MKMKLERAVVVEGKYDKIKLSNIVDTLIIQLDGFSVFKNKELQSFIKLIAKEKGIIILTDSDSAGFLLRNFVSNLVGGKNVFHAYIPDIEGKEKRKDSPSKEGKIGVEGVNDEVIIKAIENAQSKIVTEASNRREITRIDLYELGFIGGENSSEKRKALLKALDFPERMNTSSLIRSLNMLLSFEDFKTIVKMIEERKM